MFSSIKVESPEEKLPPKSQDPPPIHYLEFIFTGLAHGLYKFSYNISLFAEVRKPLWIIGLFMYPEVNNINTNWECQIFLHQSCSTHTAQVRQLFLKHD